MLHSPKLMDPGRMAQSDCFPLQSSGWIRVHGILSGRVRPSLTLRLSLLFFTSTYLQNKRPALDLLARQADRSTSERGLEQLEHLPGAGSVGRKMDAGSWRVEVEGLELLSG